MCWNDWEMWPVWMNAIQQSEYGAKVLERRNKKWPQKTEQNKMANTMKKRNLMWDEVRSIANCCGCVYNFNCSLVSKLTPFVLDLIPRSKIVCKFLPCDTKELRRTYPGHCIDYCIIYLCILILWEHVCHIKWFFYFLFIYLLPLNLM